MNEVDTSPSHLNTFITRWAKGGENGVGALHGYS